MPFEWRQTVRIARIVLTAELNLGSAPAPGAANRRPRRLAPGRRNSPYDWFFYASEVAREARGIWLARRAAILAAAVPTATRAREFSTPRASRRCYGLEGRAPLYAYGACHNRRGARAPHFDEVS